ncbi:MAG: beta-ketoacyl synthase chain length factor [Deltaproteobacteria bacterium]|nr:beta-ketoacyl synthase chain length factor [Candidatus Tharpella sp.]
MIPLAIDGIGPVGAFGAGMDEWLAALKGERKVEPEWMKIKNDCGIYQLPVFRSATKNLTQFCKSRELRRFDHFSKMALLGACLACENSDRELIGERTGLIVASAYGASATTFSFLDSVIEDGDVLASPTLFSNSVHNAAAAHIAKHLKITGPNLSLTQGRLSVPMALLSAAQWLAEERVDTVLCGVVDEYCGVLGYCWQAYLNRKKTATGENRDHKKLCGPGEGALFFQLSRSQDANALYGFLEEIVPNSATISNATPFISTPDPWGKNFPPEEHQSGRHLPIDLSQICGLAPTSSAFDLAAAATMLRDQTLYLDDPVKGPLHLPFSGSGISCRQADFTTSQKPLTGNCYWITNCLR